MSVPASPRALTTPAKFLAYHGARDDDDGKNTDKAQRLINAYSDSVIRFTKRQLAPHENGAEKIFSYDGSGYLSFGRYEAREITSVTVYTDRAEDEWWVLNNQSPTQSAQWKAHPRNKGELGTYWTLELPELGRYHPYFNPPVTLNNNLLADFQVTVLADWGVAPGDIPYDVELAVWIAVSNAWINPEAHQNRSIGPLQTSDYAEYVAGDEDGLALPRASRSLLYDFRRRVRGR